MLHFSDVRPASDEPFGAMVGDRVICHGVRSDDPTGMVTGYAPDDRLRVRLDDGWELDSVARGNVEVVR